MIEDNEKVWNNANMLYESIVHALEESRLDQVERASQRLLAIDPDQERAQITRGIVLLHLNEFARAAVILEECVRFFGESGAGLTNLAKAYDGLGETERAMVTLRRSLHVNPNQNAGVMWYAKVHHEQGGITGMVKALEEIASLAGSWRALLWLARMTLDGGRHADAVSTYRRAIAMGYDSDALLMISGDLGKRGLAEEAIGLVVPKYDPSEHDPRVGLNLLQCFLDLMRWSDGEQLLSRMRSCLQKTLASQLDGFAREFERLRS